MEETKNIKPTKTLQFIPEDQKTLEVCLAAVHYRWMDVRICP